MADEKDATKTSETIEEKLPEETETVPDKKQEEKKFTQAELDKVIKERLDREDRKRKEAEATLKSKADEDALKEQAKWKELADKQAADLDTLKKEKATLELQERKRKIADKVGLPQVLSSRLVGETDEELENDAKELLKVSDKKQGASATNPGNRTLPGNAEIEKILGRGKSPNVFDPAFNGGANGGGVLEE